jgi:hypothetical protein
VDPKVEGAGVEEREEAVEVEEGEGGSRMREDRGTLTLVFPSAWSVDMLLERGSLSFLATNILTLAPPSPPPPPPIFALLSVRWLTAISPFSLPPPSLPPKPSFPSRGLGRHVEESEGRVLNCFRVNFDFIRMWLDCFLSPKIIRKN